MATVTLLQTPDVCVMKTEEFDVDFAQWIVNNKDISKDERDAVRRLMKGRVNGNKHDTLYKLGKDIKHEMLGRLCAVRGESLQGLSRECRAALAGKFYWDVDIRNAQPVLLQQYAEKRGWVCDVLKRYNENRDDYIQELMEALNIERWEAKEKVCRVVFGGGAEGLTPFFVTQFYPEMSTLMKNIFTENKTKHPSVAKRVNSTRAMTAFILQSEERECLLAMDKSLAERGRSLDVLIHDGGLVRKRDGETHFPEDLLRKVEADVKKTTGYSISLAVKPMTTSFVREEDAVDDYTAHKKAFEETGWKDRCFFKLRHPPMFVAVDPTGVKSPDPMTRTDLLQNEENHECADGTSFIKRWLTDSTMKEYTSMEFNPGGEVKDGVFNMFLGLPMEAKEGDWSLFDTLLKILANNDPQAYEYIDNWNARRVQCPGEKSRVCLVFKGKKGAGKDTMYNEYGKLFGPKYFFNTNAPENNVFARFNSQIAQAMLIKFEEANFATNKANEDQLKGLITSETATIEKKGHPVITVGSFTDCVMTTNKEIPIPMTEDERRFAAFSVSEERVGDFAWWAEVHRKLKDPSHLQAYYYHLLHKDISGWSPLPVYKTQYYKDLVGVCAPIHARYFCDLLHETGMDHDEAVSIGTSHELMRAMNAKFPKFPFENVTRFGMTMRDYYVDKGVLLKNHTRNGVSYTMYPQTMRTHLETMGWWEE